MPVERLWISMGQIIDGLGISIGVLDELKSRVVKMAIKPRLTVVLVGEDPGSKIYVSMKEKKAKEIGMGSEAIVLPEKTTQTELLAVIKRLNDDKHVTGILVQLPLPKHINEKEIIVALDPEKDVDGLHPVNMGKLLLGQISKFVPCTPLGIMEMLKHEGISLSGKNAVVIGRSNIVGKPIAQLLMRENATVTVCHSKTRDIKFFTKNADLIVAAVGIPKFVTADMISKGVVLIDVGINRVDGKVIGDIDYEGVKDIASAITPVPKGVGPMTIAMLLKNCVAAAG
jgi:methylenetetrahydrofolate dehydrogenase (NADP+) / methenyltetrahydrofolate cyclohydrolase